MSNINDILVEAAIKKIERLLKTKPLSEALQIVKEDYELNDEETNKIDDILSKNDGEVTDDEDTNTGVSSSSVTIDHTSYVIYFESEEELSDSIGRLMYNRIPWEEQSSEGKNFIKFKNDVDLSKAIKILTKYNFIADADISIASICFDNMDDFKKVLNFIKKNDMYYDIKIGEINTSPTEVTPTEFDALNKRNSIDINVDEFPEHRNITVRKKW